MPEGLTSPVHLLVVIAVALIVLGPEELPRAMRRMGEAMGEVRRWSEKMSSEVRGFSSLDSGDQGGPGTTLPEAPVVPGATLWPGGTAHEAAGEPRSDQPWETEVS